MSYRLPELSSPTDNEKNKLARVELDSILLSEDGNWMDLSHTTTRWVAKLPSFWRTLITGGGELTWGPPPLQDRLIAWTVSPNQWRRSIGVLTSRLGLRPELLFHFSIGLSEIAGTIKANQDVVLLSHSSPATALVARGMQRVGIGCVRVVNLGAGGWRKWRIAINRQLQAGAAAALISPSVAARRGNNNDNQIPLADRFVALESTRLYAAHVREVGATVNLLHDGLSRGLAVDCWLPAEMARNRLTHGLRNCGANVHLVDPPNREFYEIENPPIESAMRNYHVDGLDSEETECAVTRLRRDPVLVHCTRAPSGPWPVESERQRLDAILATCEPRDALASLKRILDKRLLLRSDTGLRGGHAAVCFSAAGLPWIAKARVYRPHRMRWDYEPYGLCFSRRRLAALGAEPVIYGDDSDWHRLDRKDQMFFQPQTSANGAIDWRDECEWRLPHDLDLDCFRAGEVVAFTKDEVEARQLAASAPCPVVALSRLLD